MIVARMRDYSNTTFYTKPSAATLQCLLLQVSAFTACSGLGWGLSTAHAGAALTSPCSWHTCGYRGNKEPECVN